jgi:hypothetical protein
MGTGEQFALPSVALNDWSETAPVPELLPQQLIPFPCPGRLCLARSFRLNLFFFPPERFFSFFVASLSPICISFVFIQYWKDYDRKQGCGGLDTG